MTAATDSHGHDHGAHGHGPEGHGHEHEHIHPPSYYVKTWAILVGLLCVSIAGPMVGIRWLTLFTAFGIAVIKAYIVCSRFMHLNIEKKYVIYFLSTALAFMALFFFAIAPDILNHTGANWVNTGAHTEIGRHLKKDKDGNWDLHTAIEEMEKAEHAGGAHGGHGGTDVAESPELHHHREEAHKKLEGVDAAMKAIAGELKAAAPAAPPAPPAPPAPEGEKKEEEKKPEEHKEPEHH